MAGLGKAVYSIGFWVRETGQALDRSGVHDAGQVCVRGRAQPAPHNHEPLRQTAQGPSQEAKVPQALLQAAISESYSSFQEFVDAPEHWDGEVVSGRSTALRRSNRMP